MAPLITLLTDFGSRDYYVGAVKGVLISLCPECRLVDLTHEIGPRDVLAAQFLLTAVAPEFPDGTIHLVVVDPGVGSARRILAVETAAARFVAPDNGLLTPVLRDAQVHAVERTDLFRGASTTFHGRDRFAPVAAALANGVEVQALGPAIDDPVRTEIPAPRRQGAHIRGQVVHIDRFGNLVTNIPAEWCSPDHQPRAQIAGHTLKCWAHHYDELDADQPGILAGSLATLEFSLNGASLAEKWRIQRGTAVEIELQAKRP